MQVFGSRVCLVSLTSVYSAPTTSSSQWPHPERKRVSVESVKACLESIQTSGTNLPCSEEVMQLQKSKNENMKVDKGEQHNPRDMRCMAGNVMTLSSSASDSVDMLNLTLLVTLEWKFEAPCNHDLSPLHCIWLFLKLLDDPIT
ncbi:tRNA-2-methylthio-N(6)-dimethylallyladenosine synthase [Trichinella pseudospiralis]